MADRRGKILLNRGSMVLIEFSGGYVEVFEVPYDQLTEFVKLADRYFGRPVRILGRPRSGVAQMETIRAQMAGV